MPSEPDRHDGGEAVQSVQETTADGQRFFAERLEQTYQPNYEPEQTGEPKYQ